MSKSRRKHNVSTAREAAASAVTSTIAVGQPQPPATTTTFPTGDCNAGLPASVSFHDVTFAEFKRLNRVIDDLPYPVTFLERKGNGKSPVVEGLALAGMAASYRSLIYTASALEATGGVPVGRIFDASLSDLKKPLFVDVNVTNVSQLISRKQLRVPALGDKTAKVTLSDDAMANLVSQQPVLVESRVGGKDVLLRLLPGSPDAAAVPLHNEYTVDTAQGFIRNPFVVATDGSQVRVSLNATQMISLSNVGHASVAVAGRQVTIRALLQPEAPREELMSASYAATGAMRARLNALTGPGRDALGNSVDTTTSGSRLPLGLYLPWRHRWVLKGYSRGELLHSLALGPQEEVTIEISTWDRRKRLFEDSAQSEFEQTTEFVETQKDTESVVREVSSQSEAGLKIGADVGFKAEVVNVNANSTAEAKTGIANASKNNLEILRESVTKASNKLKLQRETKISETTEFGTENKITRKVRNPNLCHTLTLNYYEVLAHYDIVTEFNKDDARLCVLMDNPLPSEAFTYTNIRYYESVLKRVLVVPSLADGFDAARKLSAQDQLCEARRRNELCSAIAKLSVTDDASRTQLVNLAKRAVAAYVILKAAGPGSWPIPWQFAPFLPVPWPILTLFVIDKGSLQKWMYLRRARAIAPQLFDFLDTLTQDPSVVTDGQLQELAEALHAITFSSIGTAAIAKDRDAMYWVLRKELFVPPIPVVFTDISEDAYTPNDAGLVSMLNTFSESVRANAQAKQTAAAKTAMEANQAAVQSDYSTKEIAEALESVQSLTEHLNRYGNHYRTMILTLMPFPDNFVNTLSMLPLIERRVLGFDNKQVALPINAALDPRTDFLFKQLVLNNPELTSLRTAQQVTLPTSGIHVETRLGDCCACEDYIVQIRERDLRTKDAEIELKTETVSQQRLETQRLRARLDAKDFREFSSMPPVLRIENVTPPAPRSDDKSSTA